MSGFTGRSRRTARQAAVLMAAPPLLVALLLLVAGCGGGSHPAATGSRSGEPTVQTLDAFAVCMRGHGVADFYFSRAGSGASLASSTTPMLKFGQWVAPGDPGSPQFQAAMKACQHLLPMPPLTPGALQALLRSLVRNAACMRAHGYPGYADPQVRNGHILRLPLPASIDTASPRFLAALRACHGG